MSLWGLRQALANRLPWLAEDKHARVHLVSTSPQRKPTCRVPLAGPPRGSERKVNSHVCLLSNLPCLICQPQSQEGNSVLRKEALNDLWVFLHSPTILQALQLSLYLHSQVPGSLTLFSLVAWPLSHSVHRDAWEPSGFNLGYAKEVDKGIPTQSDSSKLSEPGLPLPLLPWALSLLASLEQAARRK